MINMILVRGGDMNMGFDGDKSMDMNSEPIHQVSVTSFYIGERCITNDLAKELLNKKIKSNKPYFVGDWKEVEMIINSISQITKLPVRLPTEAEWEFAACSDQQSKIFVYNDDDEFCSDFFGKFENLLESTIDPTGPTKGRRHVVRYYGKGNKKFDRDHDEDENRIRLVIKAKELKIKGTGD